MTRIDAGAAGSAAKSEKRLSRSSLPPRSRPAAGSSSKSNSGSAISAREICTRFRSPSLSVPYLRSASSRTPKVVSNAIARDSSQRSYASFQRPRIAYAAVSTTSLTISSAGISSEIRAPQIPMRVRSSDKSVRPISLSRRRTFPRVGKIRVAKICRSVDLPAPLGPRTTHRSLPRIAKVSGPRIVRSPRTTETSRSSRTYSPAIGSKIYLRELNNGDK